MVCGEKPALRWPCTALDGRADLVLWLPILPDDIDRIKEYFQGDGFLSLQIRVEVGKANVESSGKTLFRSDDLQSAAHCTQCA